MTVTAIHLIIQITQAFDISDVCNDNIYLEKVLKVGKNLLSNLFVRHKNILCCNSHNLNLSNCFSTFVFVLGFRKCLNYICSCKLLCL